MLELVAIVKAEFPEPETELGLKEAVAPTGSPLAERLTAPENPPLELTDKE